MSIKITTHASSFTTLPPPVGTVGGNTQVDPSTEMENTLFGSALPKTLDPSLFPDIAETLSWLRKQKTKLAFFVGDKDTDYEIVLAEGEAACINKKGEIFIGQHLLVLGRDYPELLIGVVAHEVGHRPKTWPKLYPKSQISREQQMQLARKEEAKADRVAGRALAEFTLSCETLCRYLEKNGHFEKQPENYYPVDIRVQMIREAYDAQQARIRTAKQQFPGYYRATSVKNLIQDGTERTPPSSPRRFRKGRGITG